MADNLLSLYAQTARGLGNPQNALSRYSADDEAMANYLAMQPQQPMRNGLDRDALLPWAYEVKDGQRSPTGQFAVPQMGVDIWNAIKSVGSAPLTAPYNLAERDSMVEAAGAVVGPMAGVGIARGAMLPRGAQELGSGGGKSSVAAPETVSALRRPEGSYEHTQRLIAQTEGGLLDRMPALSPGQTKPEHRNLMTNGLSSGALTANSLDMSHAARLQRARELGFDVDNVWYHGSHNEFQEFSRDKIGDNHGDMSSGFHFSSSPEDVLQYAPNPQPYFVKSKYAKVLKSEGHPEGLIDNDPQLIRSHLDDGYPVRVDGDGVSHLVVSDPTDIRSVNAAFDPTKSNSANLLASDVQAPQPINVFKKDHPGIRAYHGSPHDFDRFDLSKIGTGEGAQAYGHGLYFAENEGVARSYRDTLGDYKNAVTWKGEQPPTPLQQRLLDQLGGPDVRSGRAMDVAALRREIAALYRDAADGMFPNAQRAAEYRAQLDELARIEPLIETKPPGRMYEVSIKANPEDFLDWDKPLSQQSEKVRQALAANGVKPGFFRRDIPASEIQSILKNNVNHTPEDIAAIRLKQRNGDRAEAVRSLRDDIARIKSGQMQGYDLVAWQEAEKLLAAGAPVRPGEQRLSARLREAGIPGIKYLDQGSRSAGEGSRNYVVFDDALVQILRKYGLLPPAVAGAVAASGQDQAQARQ